MDELMEKYICLDQLPNRATQNVPTIEWTDVWTDLVIYVLIDK